MKIELISVIGLLLCLLVIGIEYILHFRLAEMQDEHTNRVENIRRRLAIHVEGVLFAPTESSRDAEIQALADEINGDFEVYELALQAIREHKGSAIGADPEALERLVEQINRRVDPVSIYAQMLESGDVYHKGYACRRLAELNAVEYKDKIRELTEDKTRDLAYNAAMALCYMGDTDAVARYLLSIQDDRLYSGRIINEFFSKFAGDRQALAGQLFEKCNKYMRCTIIKTLPNYKIEAFRPMYIEGATGNDVQMKIACVKALSGRRVGALGKGPVADENPHGACNREASARRQRVVGAPDSGAGDNKNGYFAARHRGNTGRLRPLCRRRNEKRPLQKHWRHRLTECLGSQCGFGEVGLAKRLANAASERGSDG